MLKVPVSKVCTGLFICLFIHAPASTSGQQLTGSVPSEQTLSSYRFGTLISAFANKAGIVVVTDSQVSTFDENRQLVPAGWGQKLVQLDYRTVVAVAGLEFVPVGSMDSISADTLGVIAGFRRSMDKEKPVDQPTFDVLLSGIVTTVCFYLTTVTEINRLTYRGVDGLNSDIQIVLAGYDWDGSAKIGKVVIQCVPSQEGCTASEVSKSVETLGKNGFIYKTAGITDVAENVLKTPSKQLLPQNCGTANGPNVATSSGSQQPVHAEDGKNRVTF